MLKAAARQLRVALDGLRILRLPLEIAACHSDLAAVLARVDPPQVEAALDFETPGLPAEITRAREIAHDLAKAIFSPEAIVALRAALHSLRGATVAEGTPAPAIA